MMLMINEHHLATEQTPSTKERQEMLMETRKMLQVNLEFVLTRLFQGQGEYQVSNTSLKYVKELLFVFIKSYFFFFF